MKAVQSKEQRSVRDDQRREFIQRVSSVGLSVPATALLLSVTQKKAKADGSGYGSSEEETWRDGHNEDSSYSEENRFGEAEFFMESDRGERSMVFGPRGPDHGGKGGPGS